MKKVIRHFVERITRPIPNSWVLTCLFTLFALCAHRLFLKINIKPVGDWQGASTLYGLLFELKILPLTLLESSTLFFSYKAFFILSLLLWFFQKSYRTCSLFLCFLFCSLPTCIFFNILCAQQPARLKFYRKFILNNQ